MTRLPLTFVLLLGAGCPSAEPAQDGGASTAGTDGAGDTDGSADTQVAQSDTDSDGSDTASAESGAQDTTDGAPATCIEFDAADCPAPCVTVAAFPADAEGCGFDTTAPRSLCVTPGEAIDEAMPTTVYLQVDGEMLVLPTGLPGCFGVTPAVLPAEFEECTETGGPQVCRCFCGADGCPYEADRELLDGCDLPTPCGEAVPHKGGFELGPYAQCVLAALRDRTPGVYESEVNVAVTIDGSRVYVDGSGDAQFIHRRATDLCFDPLAGTWEATQTCTLKPASYFADCLAADASRMQACLWGETWFDGCAEVPAACP